MKEWMRQFLFYALSCFALGSVGYYVLYLVMPDHYVFGALYRMFLYHWDRPLQYVGVVSIVFGGVGATWSRQCRHLIGLKRGFSIVGVMALSVLISSPVGGMLWRVHDMVAGYFPRPSVMVAHILEGAWWGIEIGWLVILLSIPYNIFGIFVGYFVLSYGQKRMSKKSANNPAHATGKPAPGR